MVTNISAKAPVRVWNRDHPEEAVDPGDLITQVVTEDGVAISGAAGVRHALIAARGATKIVLTVRKAGGTQGEGGSSPPGAESAPEEAGAAERTYRWP